MAEPELKPILSDADLDAAFEELGRLWGAPTGTDAGDRLDRLVDMIAAYEEERYQMGHIARRLGKESAG